MIARIKTIIARRRLEKLVERTRLSAEVQSYRKHRAAALKGMAR